MVLLKAKNPSITDLERTQLTADASSGATSLSVDNTEGFAVDDFVVVGVLGTEIVEAVRVTAITNSTTLAVTATGFAHVDNDAVVKSLFDQIRFYNNVDSFGTAIATSDIDWNNPNESTHYNDTTGNANSSYKFSHFNSRTSSESGLSAEFKIAVFYCSVSDVSDYLNLDATQTSELRTNQVIKILSRITDEIKSLTNTSFRTETIDTSNYEYHDGKKSTDNVYFVENKPIINVTTLEITTSDESVGPTDATWNVLTEDIDFTLHKETGSITLISDLNKPSRGDNRFRVAYTWGHATIPSDVRLLATLLAVRHLSKSGVMRNIYLGREGSAALNTNALNTEIDMLVARWTHGGIENS